MTNYCKFMLTCVVSVHEVYDCDDDGDEQHGVSLPRVDKQRFVLNSFDLIPQTERLYGMILTNRQITRVISTSLHFTYQKCAFVYM